MRQLPILLSLIIAVGAMASTLPGQETAPQFFIAYRTMKPETLEFEDREKAQAHAEALRNLGMTPLLEDHAGHLDVTCAQPRWTLLVVANDELVHQWENWLKKAGFQTLHGDGVEHTEHDHGHATPGYQHKDHTTSDSHTERDHSGEIVTFRALRWVTDHDSGNTAETADLLVICKALGCQVREESHGGHVDVRIRCPDWRHVECANHAEAERLRARLKKLGFEARHKDEGDHPPASAGQLQPIR